MSRRSDASERVEDAQAENHEDSASSSTEDAASDGGVPEDAAADTGVPISDASIETVFLCGDAAAGAARVDVSCNLAEDCEAITHNINCCGTRVITGVNRADSQRAQKLARECAGSQPLCDCLSTAIRADDGTKEVPGFSVRLECVAHRCRTTYRKPRTACGSDGGTCDADREICVGFEAWTTHYECKPLPAGCENERSCDCDPATLCSGGAGGACTDTTPNTVVCVCLTC